jgi:hypothetical protein
MSADDLLWSDPKTAPCEGCGTAIEQWFLSGKGYSVVRRRRYCSRACCQRDYARKHHAHLLARGRDYSAAYRRNHPAQVHAAHQAHYAANREQILLRERAHRQANRDAVNARWRQWRDEHRESVNARKRVWRAAHRDERNAGRRASRRAASGANADGTFDKRCAGCGQAFIARSVRARWCSGTCKSRGNTRAYREQLHTPRPSANGDQ